MTDEKFVDAGDYTSNKKYYKSFAQADEDIRKLTKIEEERVKKLASEEIRNNYSGPIVS